MVPSETSSGGRALRWAVTGIWSLAVFALLLLAVYAGLGRYLITQVGVYEADLEALLSERLGRTVQIETFTGSWVGLDPVLHVDGLTVGDPDAPDAALQRVRIRLATVSTLVRGRLVFSEFSANHADLTLTQDSKGVLGLAGLWQPPVDEVTGLELLEAAVQDFDNSFSDWIEELGKILADPVVRVSDLRLTLRTPDHEDQHYQIPAIDLAFQNGVFSAQGRLNRVDTSETIAWFTLEGSRFFSGSFDGAVYLDIRSERLFDTFLQRYEWFDVGVNGLDLRAAIWLDFAGGDVSGARARVETPYLQLRAPAMTLPPIEDLGVTLAVERLKRPCPADRPCGQPLWRIQARDLQYRWQDDSVGPVNLVWAADNEGWHLGVDSLPIGSLAELAVALDVLPAPASQALTDYRPQGDAERLNVHFAGPEDYRITADLRQVGVAAHAGAPVVDGLDGWFEQGADGGRVIYDSANIIFGFPELFAGAWQFERMTGEVHWQQRPVPDTPDTAGGQQAAWQVQGQDLRFQYTAEMVLGGAFEVVLGAGQRDSLALRVGLVDAKAKHLSQFVPVGAVGEELYGWLTTALKAGTIPWGWYYGYGPIGADEAEAEESRSGDSFTSAMAFDFRGFELLYTEGWPPLTQADGQFRYQAGLGWVDVDSALLGGLEPLPSQVRIDTREGPTRVDVRTGGLITGDNLRYWLDHSPLNEATGDPDSLGFAGSADLALGLTVFPGSAHPTQVDASLDLQGLSITHSDSGYSWRDLTGAVNYNSLKGLSADDVKGRFLEHEVRFSLSGATAERPVEVHQWGRATVGELKAALDPGLSPLLAPVDGAFDYDLRGIGGDQPVLGFQLNLTDLAVDLPAPLAKEYGEDGLLQGNLVQESDGRLRLQGAWQDVFAYQLVWEQRELREGSLEMGAETATLQPGRFYLGGSVDYLNLDQWSQALEPLLATNSGAGRAQGQDQQKEQEQEQAPEPFNVEMPAAETRQWPVSLAVTTGQLLAAGYDFGPVDIGVEPSGADWRIELAGPRASGTVLWREADLHQLSLERLQLIPSQDASVAAAESDDGLGQPADYPSADVAIKELWLGDRNYGSWAFQARSTADILYIDALEAHTGSLAFTGGLVWQQDAATGGQTRLTGELEGGNIRDLNAWLEAGVPLDSRSTKARLDLTWPGPPQGFALATVRGEMALGLKDGTILDENNVAQIFRVFGILNADTLMRRLRLDFSDLYKAGVSFEALSGSARVAEGVLALDPELQLTGPSGAFRLTGSTDLVAESLDMRLVVVLPLTQNLPAAALLFGAAAPVGGALFILDKLLGDPLSKLTSATYDVSGGWDKPNVKLRSIFDTGSRKTAADTSGALPPAADGAPPEPRPESGPEPLPESGPESPPEADPRQ